MQRQMVDSESKFINFDDDSLFHEISQNCWVFWKSDVFVGCDPKVFFIISGLLGALCCQSIVIRHISGAVSINLN